MMTNNTCVCGHDEERHYHPVDNYRGLPRDCNDCDCRKFTLTPTHNKASEPAEGDEPKYIIERKPRNADPPYSHIPWERVPDTIGHDEEVVMGHALVVALNTGKLDATKYNYRIVYNTKYQPKPADHPDLVSEAKDWLELHTPLKWATEPDPECPDEPLESLNARQQRWANRLAAFAQHKLQDLQTELDITNENFSESVNTILRLEKELLKAKSPDAVIDERVKLLEEALGAMIIAFGDRGNEPADITEGTRDAAMKVAIQDLSENPEWVWVRSVAEEMKRK